MAAHAKPKPRSVSSSVSGAGRFRSGSAGSSKPSKSSKTGKCCKSKGSY